MAKAKRKTPRKKVSRKPTAAQIDAKYRAQEDLRTLQAASEIQKDSQRMAKAKQQARLQIKALTDASK